MALTGPNPSGDGARKGSLRVDWVEVLDLPFDGPSPAPSRSWRAPTKAWWSALVTMPHCKLWSDTDWQFALETAGLKDQLVREPTAVLAGELRQRSALMGMTYESRLKLRIRYVDPAAAEAKPAAPTRAAARDRIRRVK